MKWLGEGDSEMLSQTNGARQAHQSSSVSVFPVDLSTYEIYV